jgi:hypothetical protein
MRPIPFSFVSRPTNKKAAIPLMATSDFLLRLAYFHPAVVIPAVARP